MISEWFTELRAQYQERLRNPLLGSFSVAWLIINWRLVGVLVFSETSIEARISAVEEKYSLWVDLLFVPLAIALIFVLVLPWFTWAIQYVQESVNLQRKKLNLKLDTEFLKSSVERAEAQAALNRILASDVVTRAQKSELEALLKEAAEKDKIAQSRITAAEEEFNRKLQEIENRYSSENEATEAEAGELEKLRTQLAEERRIARSEAEMSRKELEERKRELESRLKHSQQLEAPPSDVDFESYLREARFLLFHNPTVGPKRSKEISFASGGKILAGQNDLEHAWRVKGGYLELLQSNGKVHSRFKYLPESRIFVRTGTSDTPSARGQYIVPWHFIDSPAKK